MIHGLIFDLDGTLLEPRLDFGALRREIGMPEGGDILAFLETLPEERRAGAEAVIEAHEERAASDSALNAGAAEVLAFLRDLPLPVGIFTRNTRASLAEAIRRHDLFFDAACTREDAPPKPSPEPVLRLARALGLEPPALLVVGDFAFDTESAIRAGALAVYYAAGRRPSRETRAHFTVDRLLDLIPLVQALRDGSVTPRAPEVVRGKEP